jgi:ankyrin repeat protein
MQENYDPLDIKGTETYKYLTEELWKSHSLLTKNIHNEPIESFYEFAINGNIKMLKYIVSHYIKQENYGFNKLHLDVLSLKQLTEKYHTASITKKAANNNITPLHLACLNPSRVVLNVLLEQNNEVNVQDRHLNKPIHYAAVCESSGPLKLLIDKGASVFDLNGQK